MEVIDVNKEVFREVEIKGHMALFTPLHVDKSTIPEGMNCYELRHGDDNSYPAILEQNVKVNYFGAVLMTDKSELDHTGGVPLAYGDFGFTDENLSVVEYLANYGSAPEHFSDAAELSRFMVENDKSFPLSEKEADVLLGYLDGHGFLLGEKDGKLFRGDQHYAQGTTRWMEDTIDDAINAASEWNYELIQEAQALIADPENFIAHTEEEKRLDTLKADEQVLDGMFDRTKYGKELDALAQSMVEELIRDLNSKGGLDGAIERMTEQWDAGKDLLPNVSPALKKGTGRVR